MVSRDPEQRPTADVILHHPALWDHSRTLSFLQDVSDRVEKEDVTGVVLETLETGAECVCGEGDWRSVVDDEVTADLRKYRSYRGDSVRDLLRALRNKRHHFRELSPEAQRLLGSPAEQFTEYWVSRFPLLLPHSWSAMQCVRHEALFRGYYCGQYTFPSPVAQGQLPQWWHLKRQELTDPKQSPKKSSPKISRGDDRRVDVCKLDESAISNSPRNGRRTLDPPSNVKKLEDETDETEKENWMKSGQEKGVYRPRMRKRQKKREEESFIWSVPP